MYRGTFDPIRKKAEQLYPDLEADAAIAKLATDIETVRGLATREDFRPLSEEKAEEVIAGLKEIKVKLNYAFSSIKIQFQQNSSTRKRVAEELKDLFQKAGYDNVSTNGVLSFNPQENVQFAVYPDNAELVKDLAHVLSLFMNTKFKGNLNKELAKDSLEITIIGEPIFTDEGVILFR